MKNLRSSPKYTRTLPKHTAIFLRKFFQAQFWYLRVDGSENKETFFARVAEHFFPLSEEYQKIERAYETAKNAFRNKKRDTGERYFEHLRSVALIIMCHLEIYDVDLICAALLHDIVEDCKEWTIDRVRAEFGNRVAMLVEQVTNPDKKDFESEEAWSEYLHHRQENMCRDAAIIKLADRFHNMFTLWQPVRAEKIARKLKETKEHYLKKLARKHQILLLELRWIIELHEIVPGFNGFLAVQK